MSKIDEKNKYKNEDKDLNNKLWDIANILRGKMDADEFKNYILGFLFFRFLSEKEEDILKKEGIDIEEINSFSNDELETLKNIVTKSIGYYFNPKYLFSNIIKDTKKGNSENIIAFLEKAFSEITDSTIGKESNADFKGLFNDINLKNPKLGSDDREIANVLSKILEKINEVNFSLKESKQDILGNAYEYLIANFASSAGKKGGEFYTPTEVSQLIAKIVSSQNNIIRTIYDPTCGSGSLLIKSFNEIKNNSNYSIADKKSIKIKGQELNHTTFNLARMNMFLHGINYKNFLLKQGDTIKNDAFKEKKFEAIVANPPFGTKWDSKANNYLEEDERFSKYGKLAPDSRAEYTFVQHMLEHLDQDGLMVTVLPHGILFRGGAEETIRRYIIEQDNALDAIIGLPSNLFFGTGIPAIIAIYKKSRKEGEEILFVDASKGFEKVKNKNKLRDKDIEDIANVYINKLEISKSSKEYDLISKKVTLEEIKDNEYNLNISRYIDDHIEVTYRSLSEIDHDLKITKTKNSELEAKLNKLIKEFDF